MAGFTYWSLHPVVDKNSGYSWYTEQTGLPNFDRAAVTVIGSWYTDRPANILSFCPGTDVWKCGTFPSQNGTFYKDYMKMKNDM